MIIEIKITSFPGKSMLRLLTSIKILTNLAKKFGFKIETKKYSEIKTDYEVIEWIVCDEISKLLQKEVRPNMLYMNIRPKEVIYARQIMLKYLIMRKISSATAAKIYGKDHATALHSAKSVLNLASTDKKYLKTIETIERRAEIKIL